MGMSAVPILPDAIVDAQRTERNARTLAAAEALAEAVRGYLAFADEPTPKATSSDVLRALSRYEEASRG